jgi:metal-responsive CopG/Arc/MetJ family transcriptional regulator
MPITFVHKKTNPTGRKPTQKTQQRIQMFFPDSIVAEMDAITERTGAPRAEIIRRAVAAYLEKQREKE